MKERSSGQRRMPSRIYLASRSPRRAELLSQIGITHRVIAADVDERHQAGETPAEYVERLAIQKARAGAANRPHDDRTPVLAADTAVAIEQHILGKPADREEALAMMALLSGRTHRVLSAVALLTNGTASRLNDSRVTFRRVDREEAIRYWESGEPADKAGGYAIQGRGAQFIAHLDGSYSGVMGLPLFETAELLSVAGIQL